jgi:hypothetical protein
MTALTLEIDSLGSHAGWMNCWIVVDGERHLIEASSVFSPFWHLLALTRAIAFNQSYAFSWDSEGFGLDFEALPVESKPADLRLQIKPFNYSTVLGDEPTLTVDACFNREQLAKTLLDTLRNFALDCPAAADEWNFPYCLIELFEQELARGSIIQTDENTPRRAHFIFPSGNFESYYPPCFDLWADYDLALHVSLGDIPRFWFGWFEILEKVRRGDFPVESVFHVEVEDQAEPGEPNFVMSPLGLDISRHIFADASQALEHFHLKVTHWIAEPGIGQTTFDLLFDRSQFVTEFARSFKTFLELDYPAFLESGESQFDLRTLPLDRLSD